MKNLNTIILFDIDRTLFDTDTFSQITSEHLRAVIGCSPEEFAKQKSRYVDALASNIDFNPEEYVENLATAFSVDMAPLRKIFLESPQLYQESIFAESIEILRLLSKDYRLGIYSEGHHLFQISKITHTGIIEHVEALLTFIEPRKVTPLVKKRIPENVIIIDDKLSVVEALTTWERVQPIWINRTGQPAHAHIPTIKTLRELPGQLNLL